MATTMAYLMFDERMLLHKPCGWPGLEYGKWPQCSEDVPDGYPFENPERIRHICKRLLETERRLCADGQRRFMPLQCQPVQKETALLVHSKTHFEKLEQTSVATDEELDNLSQLDEDIYYCRDTFLAATLACGGVVSCVDAVTRSEVEGSDNVTRAIAVVRPPGHHACQGEAMGFCFLNSVAVAAKHALSTGRAKRVVILDWDVHHGNSTQDLTYDDPNILYMSLHRFAPPGEYFFPSTGTHREIGTGSSLGTNINIPWTSGVGNCEYAAAFSSIVLPALASFSPDLVLVSCGLDAARGDLLGGCDLTPDMFYAMTRSVLEASGPQVPIVVALEGGYNIDVIAECMEAVSMALLDEKCFQGELLDRDASSTGDALHVVSENDAPVTNTLTEVQFDTKEHEPPTPPTDEFVQEVKGVAERIQTGQQVLSPYWRSGISRKNACIINKTIDALEKAPFWTEKQVFQKVASTPTPKNSDGGSSRISRTTRSSSRNSKDKDDMDSLDDVFQSLNL